MGQTEGGSLHTNCFLKGIFAYRACGPQVDVKVRITPERGQGKKLIWSWGLAMKC